MDDQAEKSCWGVTVKAVIGIAALLALAWLVGGAEAGAVAAL